MNPNLPDLNELLDAARNDAPPPGAKAQIKSALDAKIREQAASPEAIGNEAAITPQAATTALPSKIMAGLLLSSLTLVIALVFSQSQPSDPVPVEQTPKKEAVAVTPVAKPTPKVAAPTAPAPSSKPITPAVAQKKTKAKKVSGEKKEKPKATTPPSKPSLLKQELALINDAKSKHTAKSYESALAVLAQHASKFPKGILTKERQLLRVLVYCEQGKTDLALQSAEMLLKNNDGASVRARVGQTCAKSALE